MRPCMYTPWFIAAKQDPVRIGMYDTCASLGGDIARCYWNGDEWFTTPTLVDRISVAFWRGLTAPPMFPRKRRVRPQLMQSSDARAARKRRSLKHRPWIYLGDDA